MSHRRQDANERRRARDAAERETPSRDPERLESPGKRLRADARPDQPLPRREDRDDEFPER